MKRLIILGAVLALAVAKPEMYKEKEDFQYSRSSSDDGTKSGYYGAQRGNMGGNYEKAHNMDNLAQNQMSGLVKQVEGELGDGANMRTGSVYTAANSRGSYGSGHYDLSNLGGRNFQEGASYDNSQARSSQSSSAYNSAGYTSGRSQSALHSGYQTAGQSGKNLQSGDLQSADNLQGSSLYDYGRHSSHSAGYQSQSGFREHSEYDLSNTNLHSGGYGSNTQTRLISATPVRVVVRPGGRVAIPVAAQTYDATRGSTLIDQNSLNTDAETLRSGSQHSVYRPSTAKHYESSYNYRKEWEKHDTIPSTVPLPTPTHNSFPVNSELYEDSQHHTSGGQYDASRIDSQRAHSSNIYSGYNANVKSSSSQSSSNYDSQHQGATSGSSLNAYTSAGRNTGYNYQGAADSSANGYSHNSGSRYYGTTADASSLTQAAYNAGHNSNLNSQVEDISGKPKSYQSSYSYHKSWERQGDPYVIKPASSGYYDGQTSQRLTSSTKNAGYAMSGSHYQHQGGVDCDENGHIRVTRSYNTDDYQQQRQNIEDLGQQVEDLGQQTQSNWDQQDIQQSQNSWDKLEDLSQQSQGNWDQQETQQSQNSWDKLEDLSQQSQTNLGQQETQQSQNSWDKLEDLSQQSQTNLDQQETQQSQNSWDKLEDLSQQSQTNVGQQETQQSQNSWDKLEDLSQQSQNNQGQQETQQSQNSWDKLEDLSQQSQSNLGQQETQQSQNSWDKLDDLTQQSQSNWGQQETQQSQNSWDKLEDLNRQPQSHQSQNGFGQHSQETGTGLENKPLNYNHETHNQWDISEYNRQNKHEQAIFYQRENSQYSHTQDDKVAHQPNIWSKFENVNQNVQQSSSDWNKHPVSQFDSMDQHLHNAWGHSDATSQSESSYVNTQSNSGYLNSHSYGNTDQFTHFQEQATNNDNFSQVNTFDRVPPNMAPLSNLWNKLNQQSMFTDIGIENNKENNFSEIHTSSHHLYESSGHKQTNNSDSVVQEHHSSQIKPHIQPQTDKVTPSVSSEEKERPEDIGRGDIGPEKLAHAVPNTAVNEDTNNELNVLSLDQQTSKNKTDQNMYNGNVLTNAANDSQTASYLQPVNEKPNQKVDIQPSLQGFEDHQNTEQHNMEDFGQQSLQIFEQNENVEKEHVQDFNQHNLEQQNLQDFGQQSMQEFNQHETQAQQDLRDLGQQNLHDFGQQGNLEQQDLQDFTHGGNLEQQNLQEYGQQHLHNLEQEHLTDFSQQESLQQQHLNQESNFNENLQQQNQQNIRQQGREKLLDYGQNYYQEQQNLQSQGAGHNLNQPSYIPNTNLHANLAQPKEVEESIQKQKNNDNLESVSNPNTELVTPIEPTTEKPGFWSSVGNKFSSAKSKIASWFKS